VSRKKLDQAGPAPGAAPFDPDVVAREMADGDHLPSGHLEAWGAEDFAGTLGRIVHRYGAPAELRASLDAPGQEIGERPAALA